jgi:hypothetical protein
MDFSSLMITFTVALVPDTVGVLVAMIQAVRTIGKMVMEKAYNYCEKETCSAGNDDDDGSR